MKICKISNFIHLSPIEINCKDFENNRNKFYIVNGKFNKTINI